MQAFQLTVDPASHRRADASPLGRVARARGDLTTRHGDSVAWAIARLRPRHALTLGPGGLRDGPSGARLDAIVVDGDREVCDRRAMTELAARLTPEGVLLVRCLDPMARFAALRVVLPTPPPSPSCAIARDLVSLGMAVAIYPLWCSTLVIGAPDARILHRLVAGGATSLAQAWLDELHARRRMSLTALTRFVAASESSAVDLERLDRAARATLAMPGPDARELTRDGERLLEAGTLRAAAALDALLEQTSPGDPACAPFVQEICQAARADGNPALPGLASLAHAWAGDLPSALAVLRG